MSLLVLKAEKRSETGKNVNRRLRSVGSIPAVIYSHGEAEAVSVNSKDFSMLFKKDISESVILTLNIGSDEQQVYVKDYQRNPVTDAIIHLDFFKITAGEKINTAVPLEFVGTPIGVRAGGVFEQIEREVEMEVLPKDLPEKIVIDVTKLEIGDSIHIEDLEVAESVTFKQDLSHVLAHVVTIKVVSETEDEVEEETEVETEDK